jgi:hypothetical protein
LRSGWPHGKRLTGFSQRDLIALNQTVAASEKAIGHARETIKEMQDLHSFEELERMGVKLKELLEKR